MERGEVLGWLAGRILRIECPHPVRVAVDGIDAAGKTTLADELAGEIRALGRPVIRASLDGFHRPRAERYQQGEDSPRGYYEDSFDYPALHQALLVPLGPGGDGRYRPAAFDFRSDRRVDEPLRQASQDAVLIVDGVFLLRPELAAAWDFRIFLEVQFEVAMARAAVRDRALFGSPEAVQARYLQRYLPAQRFYLETARPQERADVVVDHNAPDNPGLVG
jgi:uridine kinase